MRGLCLALLLPAAAAGGQAPPTFRSEIGLVVIQATVRNERGEAVTGLERGDFTVYENGARQTITSFRDGEAPISLGLLLDHSRSMRDGRPAVEAAARAALTATRPPDETFLMNFADKFDVDVPLTTDLEALRTGLTRTEAIGGTALRDAVKAGTDYLTVHARRGRKVLVVVTDGNDNASVASPEDVREDALEKGVEIYAVGILNTDPEKAKRGREALDRLTASTGGFARYAAGTDEADGAALALARQVRQAYTIAYAPSIQALDGTYRKLRVVAKGPGKLSVRTRRGYRAAPSAASRDSRS